MLQFVRAFKGISHAAHAVRGEIETGGSGVGAEAAALADELLKDADPLFSSGQYMAASAKAALAGKLLRGEIKIPEGSPQDVAAAIVKLRGGYGSATRLTVPKLGTDGTRPEDWIG